MSRYLFDDRPKWRREYSHGKGRIAGFSPGLVTVDGAPAARDVTLIERNAQRVMARTVSAADGTYEFRHLDMSGRFVVYAWDRFDEHNAAIADNITPALMPLYEP